jgi:SAM-dependent methyltransferase
MPRPGTLAILLGAAAVCAAGIAVARHRGAARGRTVPGGTLIGDAAAYDALSHRFLLGSLFRSIAANVAAVAPQGGRVLEVGCGSGRFFPYLVRHGVRPFGIALSPAMVARARSRLGEPAAGDVIVADMVDFDLGRTMDGAFCAVNTVGYLVDDDDFAGHLRCVADHLEPEGRYLVQMDLYGPDDVADVGSGQTWDDATGGAHIRFTWEMRELDVPEGRAVYRSRIEVLDGDRAGHTIEEDHHMRVWTWETWSKAITTSPFAQVGAYDGDTEGYPLLEPGDLADGAHLVWHELVREDG